MSNDGDQNEPTLGQQAAKELLRLLEKAEDTLRKVVNGPNDKG